MSRLAARRGRRFSLCTIAYPTCRERNCLYVHSALIYLLAARGYRHDCTLAAVEREVTRGRAQQRSNSSTAPHPWPPLPPLSPTQAQLSKPNGSPQTDIGRLSDWTTVKVNRTQAGVISEKNVDVVCPNAQVMGLGIHADSLLLLSFMYLSLDDCRRFRFTIRFRSRAEKAQGIGILSIKGALLYFYYCILL